ncbi:hypothetical protein P153DRAFT_11781 [Dothidotthia symphoricarpi CBS 119687]|uniref:Uncharacterized protein n=1 Tax=Dothidotthia symphoricarpi CBS 119687 TaxID=1392245 RepID=A0A6A6AWH8_9PLEO|nr:uncharacterized protein P153DRAFT_11781 [Dothidotthia symphoricarpi CBS 119687]KAF2134881.1 hypothetical protein P153DRAFT_11781 [Dothidotthia symphoricarpi CBS 119687]
MVHNPCAGPRAVVALRLIASVWRRFEDHLSRRKSFEPTAYPPRLLFRTSPPRIPPATAFCLFLLYQQLTSPPSAACAPPLVYLAQAPTAFVAIPKPDARPGSSSRTVRNHPPDQTRLERDKSHCISHGSFTLALPFSRFWHLPLRHALCLSLIHWHPSNPTLIRVHCNSRTVYHLFNLHLFRKPGLSEAPFQPHLLSLSAVLWHGLLQA